MKNLTNNKQPAIIHLAMKRDGLVVIPRGVKRADGSAQQRDQPLLRLDFKSNTVYLKNRSDGREYVVGSIAGIRLETANSVPSIIIGLSVPITRFNQ